MKRMMTQTALLAVFLIYGSGGAGMAEANGSPQLLTGILQKMEKAHQELKSLKAAIMQQTINSQMRERAAQLGAQIQAEQGTAVALEHIHRVLRRR